MGGLVGVVGWAPALLVMAVIAALIIPLALGIKGRSTRDSGSANSLREALNELAEHKGLITLN